MLVLSSPSGAGKTSICKKVISLDRKISLSVSYTTRPKRKSEKEGKDYFFVSKEKFEDLKKKVFLLNLQTFLIIGMELQKILLKKILTMVRTLFLILIGKEHKNSPIFRKMMLYQFLFYHQVIKNFMRDLKKEQKTVWKLFVKE